MSYKKPRGNHYGRRLRNQRTHELIDMILFYSGVFNTIEVIRLMR